MSHAYVCNLMHCTFSTKGRNPWIDAELEQRLWPYIGGIARENRMKALAIGGVYDHLHALLSLPGSMSFAKAVQLIKGGSSKWIHDEIGLKKFEGRKDMERLVSASLKLIRQSSTLTIRKNTIVNKRLKRSSCNCSTGMRYHTIAAASSFEPQPLGLVETR